jgi:hypothetical protein
LVVRRWSLAKTTRFSPFWQPSGFEFLSALIKAFSDFANFSVKSSFPNPQTLARAAHGVRRRQENIVAF